MKYLKILLLLIGFISTTLTLQAVPVILSNQAEINLLTCDPGDELYSQFGHTAIHVKDPVYGINIVYNYGTFDFRTKHFYFKFARGTLLYQLTCSDFNNFMAEYRYNQRSIHSQTLILDSVQKQRIFYLLEENLKPENRNYLYNFLYDNCTTRARDIIAEALGEGVIWGTEERDKSFWNLLDEYLEVSPWIQWGIHTILGSPASADATGWEEMFLPDYLMYGVDSAYFNGTKLAQPIQTIYKAPKRSNVTPWYFTPLFIFGVGVLLLILIMETLPYRAILKTVAITLFLATGVIGVLLIFLGFFTLHPTTAPNYNLLWANPLNLIALLFLGRNRIPGVINLYLGLYLILLIIALLLWFLFTPAVLYSSLWLIILMGYVTIRLKKGSKREKIDKTFIKN